MAGYSEGYVNKEAYMGACDKLFTEPGAKPAFGRHRAELQQIKHANDPPQRGSNAHHVQNPYAGPVDMSAAAMKYMYP